ncbi:hypothetical protein C8F04DRAFT_645751 [Mycena alexandri]|uniref:Uncharacterized protein n=1 Tax=Mycena alexandri TaxID=1745969 RepID=A0AAD6SU96_9AGAR|nr:hypothetical protein C8F04DRAFT_645751 [Mycena alexandri]
MYAVKNNAECAESFPRPSSPLAAPLPNFQPCLPISMSGKRYSFALLGSSSRQLGSHWCVLFVFPQLDSLTPPQSVLATIFSVVMPSSPGPAPIIHLRQAAAVAASARSPKSLSADDPLPRKEIFRLVAPKLRGSDEKLFIDVEGDASGDSKIEATLVLSPVGLSPQETKHSEHVVHFKFPVEEISSPVKELSASPAPTHRSLHSESSRASSEVNTISSSSSDSTPIPPAPERRRHKLRFSKLVHIFTDKHGDSKARRRDSVSELRADATPLSPIVLSPSDSVPASHVDTPVRSQSTRRPRHRSLIRVVSCPILHYTHPHERTSRSRSPPPPVPTMPPTPTSPVTPRSPGPRSKMRKVSFKKEKEVVPRPRTQPYAAPYFIPPPDSVDVEEPLVRRRPSRRRTMETIRPSG